jgi:hydroxymethylpyrimidine/phosphomethylpyrimidine kinase
MKKKPLVVLTIAGSDSGGGAGIQADLKTFESFGVFGTSAITCLTAQNPAAVKGISAVRPDMVAMQISAVCEAFNVAAAKTGMLYSAGIIRAVAAAVRAAEIPFLVVDPVMVATSGVRLLKPNAARALRDAILPLATVITPNIPEAEVLSGMRIKTIQHMKKAAREIGGFFNTACVVKGGHFADKQAVDILFDPSARSGNRERMFSARRIQVKSAHGTGCMFSAALASCLARGDSLGVSVEKAKSFVRSRLRRSI